MRQFLIIQLHTRKAFSIFFLQTSSFLHPIKKHLLLVFIVNVFPLSFIINFLKIFLALNSFSLLEEIFCSLTHPSSFGCVFVRSTNDARKKKKIIWNSCMKWITIDRSPNNRLLFFSTLTESQWIGLIISFGNGNRSFTTRNACFSGNAKNAITLW